MTLRVAIIGAGFSGMAAAIALQRKGITDYVILEQADGVGGTWWHNRYPGAEVDLESHIYSFSFERSDWTRTHATWDELQAYLERVARKWGLMDHLRLGEKVESVIWSDQSKTYRVETSSGDDLGEFNAVISAVGFLNIPLIPPFARGEHPFTGDLCHTSTWPDGLTMHGKRVGILGTGSSAVQVIAEAARDAESVTIFQLEPNWLLPKGSREFTPAERAAFKNPLRYAARRAKLYMDYDFRQMGASHARLDGRFNRKRKQASIEYLRNSLASRPDLIPLVTPAFAFEGRRTVISDDYYPALLNPKVTLVPHPVAELSKTGAIDSTGVEHELDVIVLATGFDAANYLGNYRVVGEHGRELHDVWEGEPEAFLGMMVPGFPNFFIMYGPNTNAIPLVNFYEAQASCIAGLLTKMLRKGKRTVSVRRSAHAMYNEWLQHRLAKTVWKDTTSYFTAGTGKVVSQWPFSASAYMLATKVLPKVGVRSE